MFEIVMCCPECGGCEWVYNGNKFECVCCGANCDKNEMDPQVFEIKE